MYSVNVKSSKSVFNLIKPFLRFKATTAITSVQYDDALPKIPGPSLLKLASNHLPGGKIEFIILKIIVFKMLLFQENIIIWK